MAAGNCSCKVLSCFHSRSSATSSPSMTFPKKLQDRAIKSKKGGGCDGRSNKQLLPRRPKSGLDQFSPTSVDKTKTVQLRDFTVSQLSVFYYTTTTNLSTGQMNVFVSQAAVKIMFQLSLSSHAEAADPRYLSLSFHLWSHLDGSCAAELS